MRKQIKDFWKDKSGIGVVEIILILVVLVGLVLLFKGEIIKIVEKAFESISGGANNIIG